jgi:hypothetical protein
LGNTANNNWPYPESTDLVKDGATAIENLADAIDTTLGVFVPSNPGLTLINTTSFSGVSSVSVSNFANSTLYRFYKILLNLDNATADAVLGLRVRENVTDRTSADWNGSRVLVTTSTVTGSSISNDTFGYVGEVDASAGPYPLTEITIKNLGFNQSISYNFVGGPLSQATARFYTAGAAYYGGATAATINGITILASAGNITGEMSLYGYNK